MIISGILVFRIIGRRTLGWGMIACGFVGVGMFTGFQVGFLASHGVNNVCECVYLVSIGASAAAVVVCLFRDE